MANHKSSAKRARQDIKRNARNRQGISAMKTSIKKVRSALAAKQLDQIDELLRQSQSVIAKTWKKGLIHKNNMSRKISRLTAAVAKAKQGV
jgi:small subunit ribosomal protein S20